ncbi:hypothetical protein P9VFCI_001 [Rhizobium phage P9VFCI]|uniref:GIY-YIG domain-containing protein n=1 Tax=Rhizobium phage P9VFCI TaxID=2763531 RepID=A0A7G7WXB0_9CAUD|nr:homing endonuclease [Rhizobium phage P9VFCI]QNH71854.1 hypothetical protein P9VFCI_001 [Rhizobium phage P9VFCI]
MRKVSIKRESFIYISTDLTNGKFYIGQRGGSPNSPHNLSYFGSGKLLKRAVDKHGHENFVRDILQLCTSQEELDEAEKEWISICNANSSDLFYNLAPGGHCGSGKANKGKKRTDESKRLMAERKLGKSISAASREIRLRPGKLLDPEGNLHEFIGRADFCKVQCLNIGAISQVLLGKKKSYKGWRLP